MFSLTAWFVKGTLSAKADKLYRVKPYGQAGVLTVWIDGLMD
jgi:hypothetical protein